MSKIFLFHHDKDICYSLDEEAEQLFEQITDKYSGQFNLKYSMSSQLSLSQPELDNDERADICVCTKATELIGSLTCVLWVYCNGNLIFINNKFIIFIWKLFIIYITIHIFQLSNVFCTAEISIYHRLYLLSTSPKQRVLSVRATITPKLFSLVSMYF